MAESPKNEDTVEIYGNAVELTPAEDELVTDVIVLARAVRYNDNGEAVDALLVSQTKQTSPMLSAGIANDYLSILSAQRFPGGGEEW